MKGIIAECQGAPFRVSDNLDLPEPSESQILVKSIYTAINPVDHMMAEMGILVQTWPFVPGCDAAGVVVKVGDQAASAFKIGDEVFGCTRLGISGYSTCQEYFLMDASLAIPTPQGLTLPEAATIGVGLETAALGIFGGCNIPLPNPDNLPAPKDEWAVVLGGASNVGRFGIQLFNACGYKVIASCGAKSVEAVLGTGAHAVFDYTFPIADQLAEVLLHTAGNLSCILDAAATGDELARALFKELPERAKYFATTNDWSGITDFEGGRSHCIQLGVIGRPEGKEVSDSIASYIPVLSKLLELGKLAPSPYTVVGDGGFDAVLEALQYQKAGSAGSSKVVVKVQDA